MSISIEWNSKWRGTDRRTASSNDGHVVHKQRQAAAAGDTNESVNEITVAQDDDDQAKLDLMS